MENARMISFAITDPRQGEKDKSYGETRAQVSRGVFISDHLRNNAADVRSKDMTAEERTIFREIASRFAAKVNFESRRGRRAEHWHLEF
jgi:hypothetical protein